MIRQLLKDIPRVIDRISVAGGRSERPKYRGIRTEDGAPVPVEAVMEQFGVSRDRAVEISKGLTR